MPMWNKMYMQDGSSNSMEHMIFFHDHSMIIICMITMMIISLTPNMKKNKIYFNRHMSEMQEMETFWTIMPMMTLLFIAMPSLKTLYMTEESMSPPLSIKTTGYQWYWSYELFMKNNPLSKECKMIPSNTMNLLDTSNRLILPSKSVTRLMITSKDVIHSWTIPSLGIKTDALPGRINQTIMMPKHPQILTGQCSEICGAGHSFMPITMEIINTKTFIKMILNH